MMVVFSLELKEEDKEPLMTRKGQAASIIPTACFKTDIRHQMVDYIENN